MVHRTRESKRPTSPIPEDPFCPVPSGFVRAKDGNPIPSAIERKLSERRRRPLSPTMLPGVRSLPKEVSETLRSQLVPGEYYAKSVTQYLGPFDHEPTAAELPSGDDYFILQSMGRMRETGKVIFRNVRQLSIPARVVPPPRPISPSELPGVRPLTNELDEITRNNLVPGKYFAKSMTRYLGPYDSMPTIDTLPEGESYVILQEMGRLPTGTVLRKVTQIDR